MHDSQEHFLLADPRHGGVDIHRAASGYRQLGQLKAAEPFQIVQNDPRILRRFSTRPAEQTGVSDLEFFALLSHCLFCHSIPCRLGAACPNCCAWARSLDVFAMTGAAWSNV